MVKSQHPFHYQLEGYKYLGGIRNHIISKYIPQVLFLLQVSGVRY